MSTSFLFDHRTHHRPKEPDVEYLIREANLILDRAMGEHAAAAMAPLYSGGDDSICSTHLCSERNEFQRDVWNIDTGTGIEETFAHVLSVCRQYRWNLRRLKSEETIEDFVIERGMPGPGRHQWVYNRIKDRCVREIVQELKGGSRPVALVTGCRSSESRRRMGHVEEIKSGSSIAEDGTLRDPYQLWVAPLANWTRRDKALYMSEMGLPFNPVTPILGSARPRARPARQVGRATARRT